MQKSVMMELQWGVIQITIATSFHAPNVVILTAHILVLLVKNVLHDVKEEMEAKFILVYQCNGFHLINFLIARTIRALGRESNQQKLIPISSNSKSFRSVHWLGYAQPV
jgi:hypothetical protein